MSVLRNVLGTGAIKPRKVCTFEKFGQAEIFGLGSGHNGMDPSTFHNVMVFMMCNTNGHVDFEQWLGQVDPRRPCALCIVRELIEGKKGPMKTIYV
jgi:hypothetical protein